MRIVILAENTACCEELSYEHGLSLYIETKDKRILFDMGQSQAFADNAQKLGIDLSKVDFAVLSHGHYDHGGGLPYFLESNRTAPVYLHKKAFEPHYNALDKDIGLEPRLAQSDRLIFTEEDVEISAGITLCVGASRDPVYPVESYGLRVAEADGLHAEDFHHEQYLLIEEEGKRICISGCSHRGILNIMNWFKPDVLVGGFHFMKLDPKGDGAAYLTKAASELRTYGGIYYTGHCTGAEQFVFLKEKMGDRLSEFSAGMTISI